MPTVNSAVEDVSVLAARGQVIDFIRKEYCRADGTPIPFAKFHIKEQHSSLYIERDGKFYRPDGSRIHFKRIPFGRSTIYWFDDEEILEISALSEFELKAFLKGRKPVYKGRDSDFIVGFYKNKFSATSSTATPDLEAA